MQYRQFFSKTIFLLSSLFSIQSNAESLLPRCSPIFEVGYKEVLKSNLPQYMLYVNISVVEAYRSARIDRAHLESISLNPKNRYEADTGKDGKAVLKVSSMEGLKVTLSVSAYDFLSQLKYVPITQPSRKKGYINVLSSASIALCKKSL